MQKTVMPEHRENESLVRSLWPITWRSFVFAPVMLLFGIFLVGVAVSLVVLPLFIVLCACYHRWQHALGYLAAWLILYCVWRGFRLRSFFEWPPSLL
jgi:hypothetical protein